MSEKKNHHSCEACVVHCMDFRIQATIEKLLESLGVKPGEFDRVSVAGGAGNFDQLTQHLNTALNLHGTKQVILTIHEDCGAGAKRDDFKEAFKIASALDLKIRAFFVKLDGTWEEEIVWEETKV